MYETETYCRNIAGRPSPNLRIYLALDREARQIYLMWDAAASSAQFTNALDSISSSKSGGSFIRSLQNLDRFAATAGDLWSNLWCTMLLSWAVNPLTHWTQRSRSSMSTIADCSEASVEYHWKPSTLSKTKQRISAKSREHVYVSISQDIVLVCGAICLNKLVSMSVDVSWNISWNVFGGNSHLTEPRWLFLCNPHGAVYSIRICDIILQQFFGSSFAQGRIGWIAVKAESVVGEKKFDASDLVKLLQTKSYRPLKKRRIIPVKRVSVSYHWMQPRVYVSDWSRGFSCDSGKWSRVK